MNIQRGELLTKLNEASPGLSDKPNTEQSDCFVFQGDTLTTFNGSVMVRVPNPLGMDVVVNAKDLMNFVAKMPDDELDISLEDGELRIKGSEGGKRAAGITASTNVGMPLGQVPQPTGWSRLLDGVMVAMQHAAKACALKDADYLATVLHVTPDWIEATDALRYVRVTGSTGFPARVLIPATAILAMEGMELIKVSLTEGWVHFRTAQKAVVSVLSGHGDYIENVEVAFTLKKPEKIVLPINMKEAIERAEIFDHGGHDFKVGIRLSADKLLLTARKDGGWYREKQRIEYAGRPLAFDVNPEFLAEVLSHTREVLVDGTKMKIEWERNQFVVCLDTKETE